LEPLIISRTDYGTELTWTFNEGIQAAYILGKLGDVYAGNETESDFYYAGNETSLLVVEYWENVSFTCWGNMTDGNLTAESCQVQIGGEEVAEIASRMTMLVVAIVALGLSFLALKVGPFLWFLVSFVWLGLAVLVGSESVWLGTGSGCVALFCMAMFITGAMKRGRR
jgi:hypothetical protein